MIETQEILYTQLATLDTPVFDHVPQGQSFPYIVIGDMNIAEWDDDIDVSFEVTADIHVWTRDPQGKKTARDIQGNIHDLLHRATIAGFVKIDCEFADCFLDEDGLSYHAVQRFNIITDRKD